MQHKQVSIYILFGSFPPPPPPPAANRGGGLFGLYSALLHNWVELVAVIIEFLQGLSDW